MEAWLLPAGWPTARGLQAGVISLDIYVNGTAVRDLTAPILLTLQGTPVARPSCAFWDEVEMVWSTQGLTVVAVENGTIAPCSLKVKARSFSLC